MIETTNMMNGRMHAGTRAGNTEGAGGDYYQSYYRELVSRGASRSERNRRLEVIKAERRRARRERWLKELKALASILISSEAAV